MDAFNLSHFSACMYPCIIAKQGLYKKRYWKRAADWKACRDQGRVLPTAMNQ